MRYSHKSCLHHHNQRLPNQLQAWGCIAYISTQLENLGRNADYFILPNEESNNKIRITLIHMEAIKRLYYYAGIYGGRQWNESDISQICGIGLPWECVGAMKNITSLIVAIMNLINSDGVLDCHLLSLSDNFSINQTAYIDKSESLAATSLYRRFQAKLL